MEGIAKYVLDEAGKEGEPFLFSENSFIRVDDVKVPLFFRGDLQKVLSSIGLPSESADVFSRLFLQGTSLCVDSMSDSVLQQAIDSISSSFGDFVGVELLPVAPSPLLQDCIAGQFASDESVLFVTYCERVSTVAPLFTSHPGSASSAADSSGAPRASQSPSAARCRHVARKAGSVERAAQRRDTPHSSLFATTSTPSTAALHSPPTSSSTRPTTRTSTLTTTPTDAAARLGRTSRRPAPSRTTCSNWRSSSSSASRSCATCSSKDGLSRFVCCTRSIKIPRYCRPEGWEYEQMMKVATGKVSTFQRCSVTLQFEAKSLDPRDKVVYADSRSVLKKYAALRHFHYVSPWNDDASEEKNRVAVGLAADVDRAVQFGPAVLLPYRGDSRSLPCSCVREM